MSQQKLNAISGSIYDVYDANNQNYKQGRMPYVGQVVEYEDGRRYVFCSTAVDIAAGQSVGGITPTEVTSVSAAVAVGSLTVSLVAASIAVNQWAKGYLTVVTGTGVGLSYRIKSNTASATVDAVSNTVIIILYDPIAVALASTDDVTVTPYGPRAVVVGTATLPPIGVAVAAAPAATDAVTKYFWAQTDGIGYTLGTAGAINVQLVPTAAGALAAQATDGVVTCVAEGIIAGPTGSVCSLHYPHR